LTSGISKAIMYLHWSTIEIDESGGGDDQEFGETWE
jgi:hypothetical protein